MLRHALITLFGILFVDQALKIWVKLNMELGDAIPVFGNWFELQFVENPGMAFGWMIPGMAGKLTLSIFRVIAVFALTYYLTKLAKQGAHKGYLIAIAMILAGALGNILDSALYGLLFDSGMVFNEDRGVYNIYLGISKLNGEGYAPFLMGNVVDMLHFPMIEGFYPDWFPWVGGTRFEFFRPVFNIADSSISLGVAWIILNQRKYFGKKAFAHAEGIESQSEEAMLQEGSTQSPLD